MSEGDRIATWEAPLGLQGLKELSAHTSFGTATFTRLVIRKGSTRGYRAVAGLNLSVGLVGLMCGDDLQA